MTIYFTADPHYDHPNIIEYEDRPWKSTAAMEKGMREIHNSIVKPEDEVWIIGDLSLMKPEYWKFYDRIIGNLNGIKHLVLGNHDECKPFYYVNHGFTTVHTAVKLNIGGRNVICAHDPAVWNAIPNPENIIFLCGHVHKVFRSIREKNIVNVGVDVWDFKPITFTEILGELT